MIIRIYKLLFLCFFLLLISNGYAQNRKFYNKAKNEKLKSISYSKELLNKLKENHSSQLDKFLIAQDQLRKQREVVNIISYELQLITSDIKKNEIKVNVLKTELDGLKKEYAQLLYFAYLNVGIQNRMIYVVSANNFNQAYKRIIYLKHLTDYRKSRFVNIQKSITDLDSTIFHLKNLSEEKNFLYQEKSAQIDSLAKLRNDFMDLLKATSSEMSSINEEIKVDETKKVVIKENVTRQIEVENTNKPKNFTPENFKLEGNINQKFLDNKKWHLWPLEKFVILHHFGDYYHPELKDILVKNDGIELGASAGSYVHSIFEGKIVNVLPIPGFGASVIIKHGNYYSVYSNIEGVKVKIGDVVSKGQVIAKLGNKKLNKMNFQLWVGKANMNPEKLNPELWLKKQ